MHCYTFEFIPYWIASRNRCFTLYYMISCVINQVLVNRNTLYAFKSGLQIQLIFPLFLLICWFIWVWGLVNCFVQWVSHVILSTVNWALINVVQIHNCIKTITTLKRWLTKIVSFKSISFYQNKLFLSLKLFNFADDVCFSITLATYYLEGKRQVMIVLVSSGQLLHKVQWGVIFIHPRKIPLSPNERLFLPKGGWK